MSLSRPSRRSRDLYRRMFQSAAVSLWIEDFTEAKRRVDRLKARGETDLRRYFENHPDAVMQIIGTVKILEVNDETLRLFRARDASELTESLDRILLPETRDVLIEELAAIGRGETALTAPTVVRNLHGERMDVLFSIAFPGPGEKFDSVFVSVMDLSDMRKAQREAEAAGRLKDEFLTTISHELRTPLNAMLGWASLLRGGTLDAENAARALEKIERNAKAQQQMIEDILDVSRMITGKLRLDAAPIELGPAIEAAVDALRPAAEAKGVRLHVEVETRGKNLVLADANRIQQIVWNLVSNAVKFTSTGGRVAVAYERINSHVEIAVSDTGHGIAREFLPHLFERFRQADSSTSRPFGGLGLGLAIVRHLVELHGGSVFGDSPGEGKGATFTVRLPLAALREEETEEPHVRIHERSAPHNELARRLSGLRVLAVDDEADTRELLSLVLEQSGAQAMVVASASEAMDALATWKPHVLVSDIGMPGEDGHSLIRRIRALPPEKGGKIPAAALTAYARSEDRFLSLASGFQTHVAKPFEPAELAAVVAGLAGRASG